MKFSLIMTAILLPICLGYVMADKKEQYHPSNAEQLANSTLAKTAQIIKNKYKLKPSGDGAAMAGGSIKGLFLSFDTRNQCTKEDLRRLLIECVQELLIQINTNESIQPFIVSRPFPIENIQIIIYNQDDKGNEAYAPLISTAEISHGFLTCRTVDSNDTFKFKNEFKETYEDALQILRNQRLD